MSAAQAPKPRRAPPAPAVAPLPPLPAPGQTVRVELAQWGEYKRRYGLRVVAVTLPPGEATPTAHIAEGGGA